MAMVVPNLIRDGHNYHVSGTVETIYFFSFFDGLSEYLNSDLTKKGLRDNCN